MADQPQTIANPSIPLPTRKVLWKRHIGLIGLLSSVLMFILLPHVLRLVYGPDAGAFDPGTINALALAVMLFMAAVQVSFFMFHRTFPRFYAYLQECMEGKVLENLTEELKVSLGTIDPGSRRSIDEIMLFTERRKLAQFQFLIRCVRLLLSLLPFFFLLLLAVRLLTAALTAVPGSAASI